MNLPAAITARQRQLNRAELVDEAFQQFVSNWSGEVLRTPADPDAPLAAGTDLSRRDLESLFESQLISRHLDLMARVLRLENKVFYTIGSSGHEGNAMVARACRHTDPAFLHYRSGAFMAERSRQLPGIDPVMDSALSFAASAEDPASGGRHKVWGSKATWVLPQTSTIASQLPKAVGTALAIDQARRIGHELPIPADSIVVCSFGDASANHSTAQGAFNAAQWAAYQRLPVPVLFVCEDNGIGISVRTPTGWTHNNFAQRSGMAYFHANGLDLAEGMAQVRAAVDYCRTRRHPVFLHLSVVRLMGHAGTDFEVEYRDIQDILANEARDPLLRTAELMLTYGLADRDSLLARYEAMRRRCREAAEQAYTTPKLSSASEVMAPLAPFSPEAVAAEAARSPSQEQRIQHFGGEGRLPEAQPPRHLAIQINQALADLMLKYPESLLFGEDVARKGGVYTVTKGLYRSFRGNRVFNTLLDEQTILGLAQGYANLGMLPIPEIQYLAYFHNACDQIRGEACSLQFFSNDQYRNPMVVRIAGLGYQKGFGGHFHNDNSIAALRDIPGLVIGCPSRGDDAVSMLRTLMALARVDGRVSVFLEPIALYMTKDLHAAGDGEWQFAYPPPGEAMPLGQPRVYAPEARELVVFTYGNGVPMALRAARALSEGTAPRLRVVDLRWLQPLNGEAIARWAADCERVLVLDEGRRSAGIAEGVITALVEAGLADRPIARVCGEDSYTPLGAAAGLVLPSDENVLQACAALLAR